MIEVNNLVKRYGDHTAVDHLSFKIEKGKIYGFLGPNGAGKSTTINMITGYIASTEGTVTIDGHDILEEPEQAKKCIGYLPEMPPLYFDMTVLEYMNFVADLKKIPKDKKKSITISTLTISVSSYAATVKTNSTSTPLTILINSIPPTNRAKSMKPEPSPNACSKVKRCC